MYTLHPVCGRKLLSKSTNQSINAIVYLNSTVMQFTTVVYHAVTTEKRWIKKKRYIPIAERTEGVSAFQRGETIEAKEIETEP